jgi:aspartyl-tRNA synthetase
MKRTHVLSEINEKLIGKEVKLVGWVDTIRIHGNVAFIDLRDRYGKVQAVISKKSSEDFEKVKKLTLESCISIKGILNGRPEGSENKELESGKVELKIDELEIYSIAENLPFEIGKDGVNEELRLKYRYLDLRGQKLKENIIIKHKIINFIREHLDKENFLEIQTPILTKSTPEGARDYVVPSRNHPGKFYALPQSPQQYKQLLMVAGIDKYFQIAPCFRDEDARADRCPGEFYQLDLEMSFAEQEDILELIETMFTKMVKEMFPDKKLTTDKFQKLTYKEAMEKYGTDKPDLRKNKDNPNELAFCWIVDFPLFEEEKSKGHYAPMHHMFTQPKAEDLKNLTEENAHKVNSYQHDLVLNGFEVGGGSVRIHDPKMQKKIFDLIGFTEEQHKYFEHMLTAFGYGVPPHGGIAPGIDRLIMVLLGEKNIRNVIAFPKNGEAKDVLMDAPSDVDAQQLKDVHIKLDLPKKKQ